MASADNITINIAFEKMCFGLAKKHMTPKKIIKSADRTIVFWDDGTKTIVRRSEDTPDDVYSAFTAAVAERIYGSNSQIKKILRTKVEVIPLSDRIKKKEAEEYAYRLPERIRRRRRRMPE